MKTIRKTLPVGVRSLTKEQLHAELNAASARWEIKRAAWQAKQTELIVNVTKAGRARFYSASPKPSKRLRASLSALAFNSAVRALKEHQMSSLYAH